MKYFRVIVLLPCLFFLGCQSLDQRPPEQFLKLHEIKPPTPDRFIACERFGCETRGTQEYSSDEWQSIKAIFNPPALSAEEERIRIARAIALMETLVGSKNNTAGDVGRNGGWFVGSPQLDCVAETLNTTVALMLLEQDGLLQYHTTGYPRHRGLLDLTGPHYSAVIQDQTDHQRYVVDSWFFDSGQQPVIVAVEKWQKGWSPEEQ